MTAVSPLDVRPRSHVPAADTADLRRTTARVLVGGGLVGAVAALALLLDRIALLENPEFVPACSINAVLSCTSVMTSAQSEVFGFPNPVIGVAAFPVVLTLGLLAVSDSGLPRWAWTGLQVGATAGVVFVHWLIGQSLYSIGALCPWCMAVWTATIPIFWYVTLRTLLAVPAWRDRPPALLRFARTYHGAIPTAWLLAVGVLAVLRFAPLGGTT
ncbi:MAG: vitamin K epoxide reductase family protein [Pseudonocardiales bacterium]|nr:vitamin K epoxide reductase family protein [Pseudonocardiales bacterium]